ncbi:MFS transporter [Chitiniphilus shinanonensis]|uniref:MFS transporter n=1 Tax=Chitiniphilus shinanonensis TaxID=553088 RepID=A0ABQ6BSW3_9NEIS|nr:MFS transporter [Chitiniphilus shinanonensis]GLS04295.1 MFS transporter [Chitiniphilus shinanonensis]
MTRRLHAWVRFQKKRLAMALLALITGVEFMENAMFVFAASHVMGGIGASPRDFALVLAAYAVGSMLMIVKQQWLAHRFGYRRYLTVALSLFALGALGSAAANGLNELIAARFVQGLGGGALFTSSRVLVNLMFKGVDRGRAVRYFMIGVFGASVVGPVLAGALIEWYGWQSIFLGIVPPTLVATAGAYLLLPDAEPRNEATALALQPLLLFACAIISLQVALSEMRYDIFAHPLRLALLIGLGAALLLGFLYQQWHHQTPVLHLRPLHNSVYLTGLGLYFLYYVLSNFSSYLFPILAEQALAMPTLTAGQLNSFAALVSLLGIMLYLKLGAKLPRKKPLMLGGAVAIGVSAWWFASLPPNASLAWLLPGLVAKGLFGVLLVIPVAGLTFRGLDDAHFAHGYQSKNLMRQLAFSMSSGLAAVLMQNRQFATHSQLSAAVQLDNPVIGDWMARMQGWLLTQGYDAPHAHLAAQALLERQLGQQALLLACDDLYWLLLGLATLAAVVIAAQRKLA